ncbi:hypothetical protein ACQP1W_51405 [Spirillospora sp. CA-255316]
MIAPLAVAVAAGTAATAAVPAAAETGPLAYLSKDTVGGTTPAQVADAAHPLVRIPATAANDVLTAKPGLASVNPSGATSRLGPGTLRTSHGEMRFTGMTAGCEKGLDGMVRGFTYIDPDAALDGALAKVPARPAQNLRVPAPKGRTLTLNKQVRDATGALTVVGAAVTEPNGLTRDYAVARCPAAVRANGAGVGKPTRAKAGERRAPEPDREGLLSNRAERSLRDLISLAQLGALPGMQAFEVPGLPGSGSRPDVPLAGAPQGLPQGDATAPKAPAAGAPKAPAAGAPKAKAPAAQQGAPAAGAPRPAAGVLPKTDKTDKADKKTDKVDKKTDKADKKTDKADKTTDKKAGTKSGEKSGKRIASAPQPGSLLPGDLSSTVTGMPGQVAGPAAPSVGAILGGTPGLPLVG